MSRLDEFLHSVSFRGENTTDDAASDPSVMECFRALADRRLVQLGDTVAPDGSALVSVKVPESTFAAEPDALPVAARTLFLRPDGRIFHRGMNKFADVASPRIAAALGSEEVRAAFVPVRLQQKMAGFMVSVSGHLIQSEPPRLVIASKHSIHGRHVDLARQLLQRMWGEAFDAQSVALAEHLARLDAVLLLEGLDSQNDPGHPVVDTRHDGRLVAFGLQRNQCRAEVQLPWEKLIATAARFRLPLAPWSSVSWAKLDGLLYHCNDWLFPGTPPIEGWVVTLASAEDENRTRIIRLKVKTRQYSSRRHLRTVLSGVAAEGCDYLSTHWASLDTYQQALVAWIQEHRAQVDDAGTNICGVVAEFERWLGAPRLRELVRHVRCFDYPPVPPHHLWLVLPVGLPGCGKTTLLARVAASLGSRMPVVYLSRDDLQAHLFTQFQERHGRDPLPRDLQKDLHLLVRSHLKAIPRQATEPTVVLLDACNASVAARREWVTALRPGFLLFLQFHRSVSSKDQPPGSLTWLWDKVCRVFSGAPPLCFESDTAYSPAAPPTPKDVSAFIQRVRDRGSHPTLPGATAETAVRAVASTLELVTNQELRGLRNRVPHLRNACLCTIDPFGDGTAMAAQVAEWILRQLPSEPPLPLGLVCGEMDPLPRFLGVFAPNDFVQAKSRATARLFATLGLPRCAPAGQPAARRVVTIRPHPEADWASAVLRTLEAVGHAAGRAVGDGDPSGTTPGIDRLEGNPRWLRTWVERSRMPAEHSPSADTSSGASFDRRLRRLWNVDRYLPTLHVTVAMPPRARGVNTEAGKAAEAFSHQLQAEGWIGASVDVICRRVLFDHKGLSLVVEAVHRRSPGDASAAPEGMPMPPGGLHITLGTTGDTPPVYCGTMASTFASWLQDWNAYVEDFDESQGTHRKQRRLSQPSEQSSHGAPEEPRAPEDADGDDGDAPVSRKKRKRALQRQVRSTFLVAHLATSLCFTGVISDSSAFL